MTASRKWMWTTLVVTLVTGLGLGVLVDRLVLLPTVYSSARDVEHRRGSHRQGEHARRMMETMRSELELSADQVQALDLVMTENHETARNFWNESRREFETLREQFRGDIRALLTDDQNRRFDELLAEREARHEERNRD